MGALQPLLLSLFAGSATVLGGLVVLAMRKLPSRRMQSATLAFAAGVMIAVSVTDLLLPELTSPAAAAVALLWMAGGVALGRAMARLPIPEPEDLLLGHVRPPHGGSSPLPSPITSANSGSAGAGASSTNAPSAASWRLGFLVLSIMTMHNLPEGLAVGVSAVKSPQLGWLLAIAM